MFSLPGVTELERFFKPFQGRLPIGRRLTTCPTLKRKNWSAPLSDKPSDRGLFGFPEDTGAAPITGAPADHCFLHSPHIASRSIRLSDRIRHGYDPVLDWTVTPRAEGQNARREKLFSSPVTHPRPRPSANSVVGTDVVCGVLPANAIRPPAGSSSSAEPAIRRTDGAAAQTGESPSE